MQKNKSEHKTADITIENNKQIERDGSKKFKYRNKNLDQKLKVIQHINRNCDINDKVNILDANSLTAPSKLTMKETI